VVIGLLGVLPLFKTNTYPAAEKPMQPPIQKKKVNCLGVKKGQGFLDLVRALPCQKRRALSRQLR